MPRVVAIKSSHTSTELRWLAASGKDVNQSRRLLSLSAMLEGMSRTEAAKIGGMDCQTLQDWAHRFNEHGPAGLKDSRHRGTPRRLSHEQLAALAGIVAACPNRSVDSVVRWRQINLQRVIADKYKITCLPAQ